MFNPLSSTEYITRSGRRVRRPERYPNGRAEALKTDKNFENLDRHSGEGSGNCPEIIIDKLGNICNNSKKLDSPEIRDQAVACRGQGLSEHTSVPDINIQTSALQNVPVEESWHFSFDVSLYEPPSKSESTELIYVLHYDENDTYISRECVGSNDNVARKLFEATTEKQDYERKSVSINGKECTFLEKGNTFHSIPQCNNSEDIFEISKTAPIPEISTRKPSSDILLENVNSNSIFNSVSDLGISNDDLEISKSLLVISTALTDEENDIGLHNVTSNSTPSLVPDCIISKDISESTYISENILSKKSSDVLSPKMQPKFNMMENDFLTNFSNLTIEPILDSNTSCELRNLKATTALANECIVNKSNHCVGFSNELLPNTDFKAVSDSKYNLHTPEPGFSQNCFDTSVQVRSAMDIFTAAYIDPKSNSSTIMNKSISNNNMGVLNSSIITSEEVDNGSEVSSNDMHPFSYQDSSEDIRQCIPHDEYVTMRERHSPTVVQHSFEIFEKYTTSTEQDDIPNLNAANDAECVSESTSSYSFDTTLCLVFKENRMLVNSSVTSEIKSESKDTSISEPVSSVLSFKQFSGSNVGDLDNTKFELIDVENITVRDDISNQDLNLNDKGYTSSDLNNEVSKKEMEGAKSKPSKVNVDKFDNEVDVGIKEVDESLILPLKKETRKKSFANDTLSDRRTDDFKFQDKVGSHKDKLIQVNRQNLLFSFSEDLDVHSKESIIPLNLQGQDLVSQQKSILESENEDKENILSPEVDFSANKLIDNKRNLYRFTRKSVSSPQLKHHKSEFASKIPELRRSVSNIPVIKVSNKFDSRVASKFITSDLKVRRCDGLKSFLAESRYQNVNRRKVKSYAPVAADVMKEKGYVATPLKTHNLYNVRNCFPGSPKSAPRRCPKKFQNIQSPVAQYIKGNRVLGSSNAVNGHNTENSTLPSRPSKASGISQLA